MSANAFAISRRLVDKGVDKSVADAVAEEIVTHSDERNATKADIARLMGEIKALNAKVDAKINMLTTLVITLVGGLYVAIGAVVLVGFIGGG